MFFFWRMGLETPQKKMDAYLILVGIYALLFLFGGVISSCIFVIYIYIYSNPEEISLSCEEPTDINWSLAKWGGQIHRPNSNFGHEPIWDCLIVKNGTIVMPIRLKMQTFIQQLWISGVFAGDYDGLCLMIHHLLPFNHHLSAISVVPGDSRSENPEGNDNL